METLLLDIVCFVFMACLLSLWWLAWCLKNAPEMKSLKSNVTRNTTGATKSKFNIH